MFPNIPLKISYHNRKDPPTPFVRPRRACKQSSSSLFRCWAYTFETFFPIPTCHVYTVRRMEVPTRVPEPPPCLPGWQDSHSVHDALDLKTAIAVPHEATTGTMSFNEFFIVLLQA